MNFLKLLLTKKKTNYSVEQKDSISQLQEVRQWYENGDYLAVIVGCDQIITTDPASEEAYRLRGFAKHKLGDSEGASQDVKKASRLSNL